MQCNDQNYASIESGLLYYILKDKTRSVGLWKTLSFIVPDRFRRIIGKLLYLVRLPKFYTIFPDVQEQVA